MEALLQDYDSMFYGESSIINGLANASKVPFVHVWTNVCMVKTVKFGINNATALFGL